MQELRPAIERLQNGDYAAAERYCRELLARNGGRDDALAVLGSALLARGAHAEAAELFAGLTARHDSVASHWINLGTALRSLGRLDEATAAYERAVTLGANSPDFLFNRGLLSLDRGDFDRARRELGQAAAALPGDLEVRFHYAQSCYECADSEEAKRALAGWQRLPGTPDSLARIGTLWMQLGEAEPAEVALRMASESAPEDTGIELRLIQMLERTNRVDAARERFDALQSRLDETSRASEDVLSLRARLAQRSGEHQLAKEILQRQVDGTPQAWLHHRWLFQLAKSCDSLGEHEASWEALRAAHASQLAYLERTVPRFLSPLPDPMAIADHPTDPADIGRWQDEQAPSTADSPIFIVGFPRSGTTLLESMLDAHPQLRSMDEQPFLQNAIERIQSLGFTYPEALAGMRADHLDAARRHYWQRTASVVKLAPGERLVDKNPLNMLRLPAIRRLFPNARIILALRHPCDVILSCYMQHFRAPPFALLCRDLPSLADGYVRSFGFWYGETGRLQPSVHELRYEDLVADPAAHARQLADFLELPWDERMLRVDEHARARGFISTPSYAQVAQPIHKRAVERWRRYQPHFEPVLPLLRKYFERWGYAG